MTFAARLLAIAFVALAVRAVNGQQYQPGGTAPPAAPQRDPFAAQRDPYAPQFQQPQYQPPPQPPSGALRYPLPSPAPQTQANQALRYPLPPDSSLPAPQPPLTPAPAQAVVPPPMTGPQPASFSPAAAPPQPVAFRPGQIMARVGDKTIFYGDIAPAVNMTMEPVLAKARNAEERAQIEASRELLTRNELRMAVRNKMLLCEFERSIPQKARDNVKEFAKTRAMIDKRIRAGFEETLFKIRDQVREANTEQIQKLLAQEPTVTRLALLMKDRKLESLGELDQALREYGSSLAAQAREFGEAKQGMQAVYSQLTKDPLVTHQEMLDYYQEHSDEFAVTAKATFEILSVKFSGYPDRSQAWNAIAGMGDAVYLGGVTFPAVAKKHSQEPRASEGGLYEKVTQGSLASTAIDQAVFSLEIGKLSQIIEDETGYHIIRVKERSPAGYIAFQDAQPDIRTAIKLQKQNDERQKIFSELATKTKVWTIYDPPEGVASQPAGTISR